MDPTDINKGEVFTSNRTTNPLAPEYQIRDADDNVVTIGEVEGSKPK
jgi:hypothetical protein